MAQLAKSFEFEDVDPWNLFPNARIFLEMFGKTLQPYSSFEPLKP
jgi:hypothetical protein